MSKILDRLIPEIKIHKHLGKELEALRETFDRNWPDKRDGWKDHTIEWQLKRLDTERVELEEAIDEMWEHATTHSSLIERMKLVRLEFLDVALCALMGADRTRGEVEKLEKRLKKPKNDDADDHGADFEDERRMSEE